MIAKNTMRYALRNQDKIAKAFGEDYLQTHIIASLDKFFRASSKAVIDRCITTAVVTTDEEQKSVEREYLRINDAVDRDAMQEFIILDRTWDVLRLAYVGRSKC